MKRLCLEITIYSKKTKLEYKCDFCNQIKNASEGLEIRLTGLSGYHDAFLHFICKDCLDNKKPDGYGRCLLIDKYYKIYKKKQWKTEFESEKIYLLEPD